MASCEIDLSGVNELIDRLQEVGRKGEKVIDIALEKGAEPILKNMTSTKMFKDHTGRLRDSLKISKVRVRKKVKSIWIGDINRQAPHGWYVENGDSKHVARPFMRTAYREEKEKALEIIKQELIQGLKNIGD